MDIVILHFCCGDARWFARILHWLAIYWNL